MTRTAHASGRPGGRADVPARASTRGADAGASRSFPRLRKSSPVPLYYQLKRAIEQLIDSGEWPPDTQVPSERRLCEQFNISRITVRQALADLEREGRLVRSHGRGTYVAELAIKKPVFPLVSFTHDVREHGLEPGARVLQFEIAPPAPDVTAALELKPGEQMLLLKRLRLANDKPLAVETVHLAGIAVPGPARRGPDQSLALRNAGAQRTASPPTRAQQQWQAVPCPVAEAHFLEVDPGTPGAAHRADHLRRRRTPLRASRVVLPRRQVHPRRRAAQRSAAAVAQPSRTPRSDELPSHEHGFALLERTAAGCRLPAADPQGLQARRRRSARPAACSL